MTLEKIEKRIETLMSSDKRWPVIVDFSNIKDLKTFLYHFDVPENKFIKAGQFCGNDETLKFDEISNEIEINNNNLFIVYITAYLKLLGEIDLKSKLKSILSKSIQGHVVIVTYQCRNYLKFDDERFSERGQILIADGDFDESPNICFISPVITEAFTNICKGFENVGEAYESNKVSYIYVSTKINKTFFSLSLINIIQLSNSYDILCSKDSRIKNVPESFGDPQKWNMLLKKIGSTNLTNVIEEEFGARTDFVTCIKEYPNYSDEKKWLYFITLSILGSKKNSYLTHVMSCVSDYNDIPNFLFRAILIVNKDDEDFQKLYDERKEILKYFQDYTKESFEFCKVVSSKQENYIYYLTDLTKPEKEKVIEWLDTYGNKYTTIELCKILKNIYPDLAAYLSAYKFKNEFLDNYFDNYKYQKVINKILPKFEVIVDEQSTELKFVSLLKPRTQLFDKIDLNGAHTYFLDALGVEYLGYIQSKCNDYGLSLNIMYGRCELPSLTCFNKDFVEVCQNKCCPITDIKDLDEIKHHGEDNFDFEKTKTPIYLIKELEIIESVLQQIKVSLLNNKYNKAVLVSDHGASRLAVLHETENIWEMETKGVHSGRCCPKNEINEKPDFAIEESDYWILANYDRFKGSRKANVEVHGGATLEEVTIPIIEITRKSEIVEAFIIDEYKRITLAAKEIPIIRIYVGVISNNISLKVNEKIYDAVKTNDKYIYEVQLFDCTKKGAYTADIMNGSDVLSNNNTFEITKKGMTEVNLFD